MQAQNHGSIYQEQVLKLFKQNEVLRHLENLLRVYDTDNAKVKEGDSAGTPVALLKSIAKDLRIPYKEGSFSRNLFSDSVPYNLTFDPKKHANFFKMKVPANTVGVTNCPFSLDKPFVVECLRKQIFEGANNVLVTTTKTFGKLDEVT